jgi:hypothetical protein
MIERTTLKSLTLIFTTCLLAYLLFWSGKHYSIDGIVMFEYAKSLLFQGSFHIDPPIYWANQEIRTSVWSLGQTLVYMPILFVLSRLFPGNEIYRQIPYDPHNPYYPLLMENTAYRYASLVQPVITALAAGLVYVLSRQLGLSKKGAWAAALIFGLASPAAAYAKYDFSQPLVSLFLLAAVVLYIRNRPQKAFLSFANGLMLGLVILTRPEMIAIAGLPLILVAFWDSQSKAEAMGGFSIRRFSSLLWFALPLGFCLMFLLAANNARFGAPFSSGFSVTDFNFKIGQVIQGLIGIVASPARGILIFFPLSLLAFLALPGLLRRDPPAGFLIAWIIIASILVYSIWGQWAGGRSWGPRFLLPILPYLSVLATIRYSTKHFLPPVLASVVFIILIAIGWVINLQGQLFESLTYVTDAMMMHLSSSPIFTGWATTGGLSSYDVFWIQKIANGQNLGFLFPAVLLPLLGMCVFLWVKLFHFPGDDLEQKDLSNRRHNRNQHA